MRENWFGSAADCNSYNSRTSVLERADTIRRRPYEKRKRRRSGRDKLGAKMIAALPFLLAWDDRFHRAQRRENR